MKFNSKPIPEHDEVPLADEGRLVYGKCRIITSEATEVGLNLGIQGDARVVAQIERMLKGS